MKGRFVALKIAELERSVNGVVQRKGVGESDVQVCSGSGSVGRAAKVGFERFVKLKDNLSAGQRSASLDNIGFCDFATAIGVSSFLVFGAMLGLRESLGLVRATLSLRGPDSCPSWLV